MPPIRKKTQTEEERLTERARVDAQMNRQSNAMSNAARAKSAAAAKAVEEDPNTPSRKRQGWISSKFSGIQALIDAMSPKKKK